MDPISKALEKAKGEQASSIRQWVAPSKTTGNEQPLESVPSTIRQAMPHIRVFPLNLEFMDAQHMLTISEKDNQILADHYRLLRTRLSHKMKPHSWNALGITSATAKAGKTFTSINLAITIARATSDDVVLIDCDVRNPSIERAMGLSTGSGLIDYLAGKARLRDIIFEIQDLKNLKIIPGRVDLSIHNRFELMTSAKMQKLFESIKSMSPAATIIVDLPPVLVGDDALSIAPFISGFIVIVRDGETQIDKLKIAMELLKDYEIFGTVLNDSDESLNHYAGYAYGVTTENAPN